MIKKMYVDNYGYSEVNIAQALSDLPETARYFGMNEDYVFYLDEYSDIELWAIPDEVLLEDVIIEPDEDDFYEDYLDAIKNDVAWCLGIEEGSDEWYELMDI